MTPSEVDHMDWYFERDNDDLIVPEDQEPSHQSPSRDYWLQLGVTMSENFVSPKEELVGATKWNVNNLPDYSSGSSTRGEFPLVDYNGGNSKAALHRSGLLCDLPDYQLDGPSEMDLMDDIFLSYLLEEDQPYMENPYRLLGTFLESEYSTMPLDNLLTDKIMDSQSISREPTVVDNSKYLKMHAFPLSADSNKLNDTPHCSEQRKVYPTTKAPVPMVLMPDEVNTSQKADGHVDDETSLDATVLQELEGLMTQFTQKTRICFRDALYRLAKSSKLQHLQSQSQSGENTMVENCLSTVHQKTPRHGRTNLESETNTIDRTVSKLMFNKQNSDARALSCLASVNRAGKQLQQPDRVNTSWIG